MKTYDPAKAPDTKAWLQLDEAKRTLLVENYHRTHGSELPSLRVHAVMHTIIENQLAENDEAVVRALARLVRQGLARHDAIHAIASVLAEHIFDRLKAADGPESANARYHAQVERLDATQWWKGAV